MMLLCLKLLLCFIQKKFLSFITVEVLGYRHPSHWGKVCFLSTPDGENCGLVKNLAVTGLVSTNISESILPQLFDCGLEELVDDTSTYLGKKDKVFLNGDWVGVCANSLSFVAELRSKRRRNELPHQVHFNFQYMLVLYAMLAIFYFYFFAEQNTIGREFHLISVDNTLYICRIT